MKRPSRQMPAGTGITKLSKLPASVIICTATVVILAAMLRMNGAPLLIVCFITVSLFSAMALRDYYVRKKDEKRAAERKEETICTFARQLNCRETDTWIIRAVYEELFNYNGYSPRLDDRLAEICESGDDIDWLALDISQRIGRPLENTDKNPYSDKVTTVRDLILFFTEQPVAHSKASD